MIAPLTVPIETLYSVVEARAVALVQGNMTFFEQLLTDNFRYVNSLGQLFDKATYIARLASQELQFQAQTITEFEAHVDETTAIVVCCLHDVATYQGEPFEADFRATQIYLYRDNRWQWAAGQTTEISHKT